jgi:hypothetical protein
MVPPTVNGVVVQVTATAMSALVTGPVLGTGTQLCVGELGCVGTVTVYVAPLRTLARVYGVAFAVAATAAVGATCRCSPVPAKPLTVAMMW